MTSNVCVWITDHGMSFSTHSQWELLEFLQENSPCWLAWMSHELDKPMSTLRGQLGRLKRDGAVAYSSDQLYYNWLRTSRERPTTYEGAQALEHHEMPESLRKASGRIAMRGVFWALTESGRTSGYLGRVAEESIDDVLRSTFTTLREERPPVKVEHIGDLTKFSHSSITEALSTLERAGIVKRVWM